jgi:hypothetical protein
VPESVAGSPTICSRAGTWSVIRTSWYSLTSCGMFIEIRYVAVSSREPRTPSPSETIFVNAPGGSGRPSSTSVFGFGSGSSGCWSPGRFGSHCTETVAVFVRAPLSAEIAPDATFTTTSTVSACPAFACTVA